MARWSACFAGLLAGLLLCSCATHVRVDYDKSTDFSVYTTYTLLPKSEASTADPRLNSPLIDKRIKAALERNLAAKGFVRQPQNQDMEVLYQINLHHEIASDRSAFTMGLGTGRRGTAFGLGYAVPVTEIESYEKVMLTIDLLAADTGELLWRGTSSRRISEARTPEQVDTFFKNLVREIMEKFPPGR